jgi:hypothetical protein
VVELTFPLWGIAASHNSSQTAFIEGLKLDGMHVRSPFIDQNIETFCLRPGVVMVTDGDGLALPTYLKKKICKS